MKNPEVGRRLRVDELVPKTVVIIDREDSPLWAFTAWVVSVEENMVAFGMGEVRTTLLVLRHPDGSLTDETGNHIRVWEYLGEV